MPESDNLQIILRRSQELREESQRLLEESTALDQHVAEIRDSAVEERKRLETTMAKVNETLEQSPVPERDQYAETVEAVQHIVDAAFTEGQASSGKGELRQPETKSREA